MSSNVESNQGNLVVFIDQVNDVNDYLFSLSSFKAKILTINDNRNSKFVEWHHSDGGITYYTIFQDIEKGYSIFIDGQEIVILEPKVK